MPRSSSVLRCSAAASRPQATTRFLGLDVHKATIAVAVAEESEPPVRYGTIANDPGAV
jgi:hypothetical protein